VVKLLAALHLSHRNPVQLAWPRLYATAEDESASKAPSSATVAGNPHPTDAPQQARASTIFDP
jgi:hypothetical protein